MFFIYYDSTRKTFSIRCQKTRRVVNKSDLIVVDNAQFFVSDRGRERVRRERKKQVHAGVVCEDYTTQWRSTKGGVLVSYNPYTNEGFIRKDTGERVEEARRVMLLMEGGKALCWAWLNPPVNKDQSDDQRHNKQYEPISPVAVVA